MDLENLKKLMIEMAQVVKKELDYSLSLFIDNNGDNTLVIDPKVTDKYEREIEEKCLNIILRERPFANDLRLVTGYFKVCEDFERLGDHAEDIEWCLKNINKYNDYLKNTTLKLMIEETIKMYSKAINSLIYNDINLASDVINSDDEIDSLYLKVLEELPILKTTHKYLNDDFLIYYTLVAKYIERIADHSTNIAEWAIYINTGFYKDIDII